MRKIDRRSDAAWRCNTVNRDDHTTSVPQEYEVYTMAKPDYHEVVAEITRRVFTDSLRPSSLTRISLQFELKNRVCLIDSCVSKSDRWMTVILLRNQEIHIHRQRLANSLCQSMRCGLDCELRSHSLDAWLTDGAMRPDCDPNPSMRMIDRRSDAAVYVTITRLRSILISYLITYRYITVAKPIIQWGYMVAEITPKEVEGFSGGEMIVRILVWD